MKIFEPRISFESVKEGLRFQIKLGNKIAQIHHLKSILAKPINNRRLFSIRLKQLFLNQFKDREFTSDYQTIHRTLFKWNNNIPINPIINHKSRE